MKAIMRDEQEMKDSGIDWIAYIPNNWKVNVLFQVTSQVKNKNLELKEQNLLSLSYGKIKRKDINTNEGLLPASFENYNIVEKDDIVLRLTDLQNDHKSLRVGHVNERGIITSAYVTLHPNVFINSNYLYYVLHMFDLKKGFYGMGAGVRQGLTYDEVKTLKICYPSMLEQQAIANYLDDRCSKIDAIIAEAKASIEEYKELKQAVIDNATLKGLNPDVNMIDSNYSWFPSIPSHWHLIFSSLLFREDVRPIKDNDISLSLSQIDGLIPTQDMKENSLKSSTHDNWKHVIPEDLILNRFKAHLGVFFSSKYEGMVSFHYGVYHAIRSDVYAKYYEYLFHSTTYKEIFALLSNGITVGLQNLSNSNFYHTKILFPPYDEQCDIVKYLDERLGKINGLISEKQSLIEDLEAYQKSLIYEVVTGKRKVVE